MSNFDEQVLLRLETLERKVDAIARNVEAEPKGKPATERLTPEVLELLGKIANALGVYGYDGLGRKVG